MTDKKSMPTYFLQSFSEQLNHVKLNVYSLQHLQALEIVAEIFNNFESYL